MALPEWTEVEWIGVTADRSPKTLRFGPHVFRKGRIVMRSRRDESPCYWEHFPELLSQLEVALRIFLEVGVVWGC